MRTLLFALFLAVPLLAQEAEEKPDKAEIRKLLAQVQAGTAEQRKDALEKLRKIDVEAVFEVLGEGPAFFSMTGEIELDAEIEPGELRLGLPSQRVRVLVAGQPGGMEIISGTSEDGTDYTLKSLGEGRFELTATQKTDGGERKIDDRGTLAELQKKHAFLEKTWAVSLPFDLDFDGDLDLYTVPLGPLADKVGVMVRPASEELRHHLALPTGAGLVVHHVFPGSRADALGLRRFDVLLKLDGELIETPKQIARLKETKGKLEIVRRAKPVTIDLAPQAGR